MQRKTKAALYNPKKWGCGRGRGLGNKCRKAEPALKHAAHDSYVLIPYAANPPAFRPLWDLPSEWRAHQNPIVKCFETIFTPSLGATTDAKERVFAFNLSEAQTCLCHQMLFYLSISPGNTALNPL